MKNLIIAILAVFSVFGVSPQAAAAQGYVTADPSSWRLQNYVGGSGVYLYYTPALAPCTSGSLTIASGPNSVTDMNRLFALISSVKLVNAANTGATPKVQVTIYYETTTCMITSFAIG